MNLRDINTRIIFDELWVRPVLGEKIPLLCIGKLSTKDTKGLYSFSTGTKPFLVELIDTASSIDLNFHLRRGCAHLAQVMLSTKDESRFMIKVVFFHRGFTDMGTVEVGIDKRIEDTSKKHENFKTQEELAAILQKKCEITDGKNTWFMIKTGAAAEDDLYPNDLGTSESTDDNAIEADETSPVQNLFAFSICGEGFTIPVEKRRLDRDTEIFFASRIVYKKDQEDKGALTLVYGNLIFSGIAKRIQAIASSALQKLEEQEGGYLAAWDRYGDEVGKALMEKAKAVGILSCKSSERNTFYINGDIPEALSENDELEFVKQDEIPLYLTMEWEEYSKTLESQYKEKKAAEKLQDDNNDTDTELSDDDNTLQDTTQDDGKKSYKIVEISDYSITVENVDTDIPPGMGLVLSTFGNIVQIERQMKARLAVKEGRSANPQLGLIIEEGGELAETTRVTKLTPLTPFVKNKVFGEKYEPTPRQLEAIDMALNTPDIALIQGPPGTGKTTVIIAILERLNEEYDKKNSIRGKVLVSGFQHDAVENIISRLSVNSLPAVKFGRRPGENEEDETITRKKTDQWVKEIKEKLQKKNPQLQPIKEQRELQVLINQYVKSRSISVIENILELIISLPGAYITNDIASQAKSMLQSMKNESVQGEWHLLASIRALRTSENDFADDGAPNALMVYVSLRDRLAPNEAELLEKAGHWKPGDPVDFLKELEMLKTSLLDRFSPRPVFNIEKPRKELLNLLANVNEALSRQRGRGCIKDEVLAGFLNELETNPEGVRAAIEDYNFVYAATTQGAEGKDIRRVKTKNPDDYVTYDTVIIDEAARVSPRDLLIPMAQAEKRIILVGDHRQLPHIIDENILRKAMETKDGSKDTKTLDEEKNLSLQFEYYIKHSMFGYLKNRLEKLSAKDNIKRTCTLDEQYRTHPLLGNFVNNYFYAPHPGESFSSPLPESVFRQNLPGLDGRPALWINVPVSRGGEERSGTSWKRREEAKVIVRQLKDWLDCEEGRNLTFGVISFYRAQSNAILEEAKEQGIADRSSANDPWEIKEEYKYLIKEAAGKSQVEERLRIGTVDSFQGMEFDVVFLSMVRSPRIIPKREEGNDYEQLKTRTFGHLVSENRLCVSMSRQKKVLVVAGDAALAQSEICREAVPALTAFCELCKTKGKFHDS